MASPVPPGAIVLRLQVGVGDDLRRVVWSHGHLAGDPGWIERARSSHPDIEVLPPEDALHALEDVAGGAVALFVSDRVASASFDD